MAGAKESRKKSAQESEAARRARETAVECARIADARRGGDIAVLYVEKTILVTDYFVITSARNKRQVQSMAADIRDCMRGAGYEQVRMEGYEEGSWVLIDCGTVVAHVFREDLREYYDLELLWGDSPKVNWAAGGKARTA